MFRREQPREEIGRLREQLKFAEEREAAIRDVIQAMAHSMFDLETVLQTVIDRAVSLCHADLGNIARLDGDVYRVVAFTSFAAEYQELARDHVYVPARDSLIGRTVLERQVVHIPDVLEDPEYSLTSLQKAGRYRTVLGIPMLREGAPIGAIGVGRSEVRPFAEAEIRLLETFADHVVVAIENMRLFQTVERQRTELARYAPEVATLLSSDEGERLLAGHRSEITALFSDLRGFTAFAETAEPEEVLGVLRQYHGIVGELVIAHDGTVQHFAGDGLMVFFNDPLPTPDHELAAVRAAVEMRDRFQPLAEGLRKRGVDLGIGIGIASGYATLGRVGFEARYDYAAIGTVANLASRLSDAAGPGEILVSQRIHAAVEEHVVAQPARELQLKGFSRPAVAIEVTALRN